MAQSLIKKNLKLRNTFTSTGQENVEEKTEEGRRERKDKRREGRRGREEKGGERREEKGCQTG